MNKVSNTNCVVLNIFSRIIDLLILNFIFLITTLPIVTLGASTTALYSVTLKMVKNEESYLIRSYFKQFKANFKQATLLSVIGFIVIGILVTDYIFVSQFHSIFYLVMKSFLVLFAIILFIIYIYIFPILSYFKLDTKGVIRNAFWMCFFNFPYSLLLLFLYLPIIFLITYSIYTELIVLIIMSLFGCSFYAFVQSYFFRHIFYKYER
ncbi:YesL family protein [Lachnospiraceae bacterium LCP25S3_G4]